jgi:hypothetical protein
LSFTSPWTMKKTRQKLTAADPGDQSAKWNQAANAKKEITTFIDDQEQFIISKMEQYFALQHHIIYIPLRCNAHPRRPA